MLEESRVLSSPNFNSALALHRCFSEAGLRRFALSQVFVVDNDKSVDSLEHLEEILFQLGDVLDHANDLNDLLVTQEEQSWEVLTLLLKVFDEALHQVFELLHHNGHIDSQTLPLRKCLIRLAPRFCMLHLLSVQSVNKNELFILFRHVVRYVTLVKDWQQISPVLLQIVPDLEELDDSVEFLLKPFDSFFKNSG